MATITGTTGNDVITGTTADDQIHGGDGADRINGGAGNDTLYGEAGNDTLTGDAGNDTLYGGDGDDGFFGGGNDDTIYGEAGADTMYGDAGNDTLYGGAGNDKLFGGTGNDTLVGGAGFNTINGGSGFDTVVIELSSGSITDAMRLELAQLKDWMIEQAQAAGSTANQSAQTTGPSITLEALGISITLIEAVKIMLDGVERPIDYFLNQAPIGAEKVAVETAEDTPLSGKIDVTDADGDVLGFSLSSGPAHGTLTLDPASGAYTYAPNANYNGADSFTVQVSDGKGGIISQTINVGVTAVNDAPVVSATASVSTSEDHAVSGTVVASDIEGEALSWSLSTGPAHGTVQLDPATGQYTYTPADNFHGSDSFEVTVVDASGALSKQTVTVGVASVNDAPEVQATATVTTAEDKAISGQVAATDIDGDTVAFSLTTGPSHGTVALDASTGAYTYTPAANFNGADSFTVQVSDGKGGLVSQTINVGIDAVNDAPTVAATVSVSAVEDQSVSGKVVATDVDGDTQSYAVAKGPAHGTLVLDATTGAYTYTPAANFNGSDTFDVKVSDGNGGFATQTVTVGVAAVNDGPVVGSATATHATAEDKAVSGTVSASDVDGDTLTWSVDGAPAHGTVTLDAATGAYTYTPAANYSGADSFFVKVTDAAGATALQKIDIAVSAVADKPTLAVVNPVVIPEVTSSSTGSLIGGIIGGVVGTILGTKGDDKIDAGVWDEITVALEIDAALVDTDGSEAMSIRISNVPAGGVLSAGTKNADGSWTLTHDDLYGLTLTAKVDQNFTVNIEAIATESDGSKATSIATIDVVMDSSGVTINGGGGNDSITGSIGNDKLSGGTGNDTIYGGSGADKIEGGKGNDKLYGGAGNDFVNGNSGDDTFYADAGNDVYAGGSGYDTLSYADALGSINVDLSKKTIVGTKTGTDSIYGSAMEKIIGSAFADTFKGSSSADTIEAGAGNDWVRGLGGADKLTGGAGSDTFFWEKTDVGASQGVDHITDFGVGDVLDFRKLVTVGSKPLSEVIKVTDGSQGLTISAKVGSEFVTVAVLDGVHNLTASELLASGHLLVG